MQLEFKIDTPEIETLVNKLIQDKLDNSNLKIQIKTQTNKDLIQLFRSYNLTKKQATEYAIKANRFNLSVETIMSSHYETIRTDEQATNVRLIKYYVKEIVKISTNTTLIQPNKTIHEQVWNELYKEVAIKTGYEPIKISKEYKAKYKKTYTGIDVVVQLNLTKEVASIAKRLYNKRLKQVKTK